MESIELSKSEKIQSVVRKVCSDVKSSFAIRFWDGSTICIGSRPRFTLAFNDKNAFRKILISPDALTAGEAFIKKQIDLEGDIYSALRIKDDFKNLRLTLAEKAAIILDLWRV